MKIKERALSLLLSLVMVLTFMPALSFAVTVDSSGEEVESDPQLRAGTIWMDCQYEQYPYFTGNSEVIPTRVISSNTDVIEASINSDASSLWGITLKPISIGKSTITVYYTLDDVEKSTSAEYAVAPFPDFASVTVDGSEVDLNEYHNYFFQYNYSGTNPVVRYSMAEGWEIASAYYYMNDGEEHDIEGPDLQKFKTGMEISYPQNFNVLRLFVYFTDPEGNEFMHSVQLIRGDEDPGDPGDQGDVTADIVTRYHVGSDGSTRKIVGDEISGAMNFPENGDNFTVNGVTYTYDSTSGGFRNGNTNVWWEYYRSGADYDESTGTYSHYFIVDYSNNGDHLGYSKIYIDYINEITGLQFIPNGKTELDARDIQTESGLDIGKRGEKGFFIPGDKIILTNKYKGQSDTYEFTYDQNESDEDMAIFWCDDYGQAPTYAYCENPVVGTNKVRIDMIGGTTTTDITIILNHEHTYDPVEGKAVSCTEDGMKAHFKCPECGKLFVLENDKYVEKTAAELTIPATGHKWGTPSYEWSADNKSVKASHKCDTCSVEETESVNVTSKVTTSPSCTQKGKTTYTATFTKEGFETQTKTLEDVDALGHDEDEGQITKRATAIEEGEMTYKCKRCNQVIRKEVIAALGEDHTPVNQAAEEAIAAVDDTSTDTAAAAEAQGAANQAVSAAEQALAEAEATGDSAAINAAKQDVADAKATEAKAQAVVARVAANKSKATASAKQAAAAAQASTGTDAAVAAAQDAVNAANAAKMDANKAVAAAEAAVAAANATNDPAAIEAAGKALNAARTAANAAANAEVAAQTTFAMAVAAKNAAASAAAAAAAPVEIIDLPTVKISKPAAAKKKITVKWKKVSKKNLKKISGIQIQVATDPDFVNIVKTATAGKKKTSKVIKGLQSKTKYYVRIRAYAAGDHYSGWKSKSAKVK